MVFVKKHKTIMGTTHYFFWWGIGGWHGLGELENAINPYMANYVGIYMWEYELIRYRLVGGGCPAASYYKVNGRPRAAPCCG